MQHSPNKNNERVDNKDLRDRVGRFIGRHSAKILLAAGVGVAASIAALTVGYGHREEAPPKAPSAATAHGNTVAMFRSHVNLPKELPALPEFPTPGLQELDGKVFEDQHGAFAVERVDPIINGAAADNPGMVILQYQGSTWQVVEGPGSTLPTNPVYPEALNEYITHPGSEAPPEPIPSGSTPPGAYAPGGD